MIRLFQEFATEADAEKWRDDMYRAYHPSGYSTHIVIKPVKRQVGFTQDFDTVWVAYGSRAESCD